MLGIVPSLLGFKKNIKETEHVLISHMIFISSLNETNIDDVITSNLNHSLFGDGIIGSDLEFITPAPIIDGMNTTIPFLNLVLPSDSTEEVKEKKMEKKKKKKRRRRRRQAEEEEGGEDEEEEEEGDDDDVTLILDY